MTPESEVPDIARKTLESAKLVIKEKRDNFTRDSEEWKHLNYLLSRVGRLKQQAIGTGIRQYIFGVVQEYNELGDPQEVSNKLKDIYTNRSLLLHEGDVDKDNIKDGLQFLRGFVPKLLEKLYVTAARGQIAK